MSREFTDSTANFLETGTPVVTGPPATLACWFYARDVGEDQLLVGCYDTGPSGYSGFNIGLNTSNEVAATTVTGAGDNSSGVSSTTFTANQWHHSVAVFTSSASRTAAIDGVFGTTDTTSQTVSGIDNVQFGVVTIFEAQYTPLDGYIAEAAIWDVALTEPECAVLAAGYSPLFVRPQNLLAYWPLIRGLNSKVSDDPLSIVGSVPVGDHNAIINPAPALVFGKATASGVTIPPLAMRTYRNRRA